MLVLHTPAWKRKHIRQRQDRRGLQGSIEEAFLQGSDASIRPGALQEMQHETTQKDIRMSYEFRKRPTFEYKEELTPSIEALSLIHI